MNGNKAVDTMCFMTPNLTDLTDDDRKIVNVHYQKLSYHHEQNSDTFEFATELEQRKIRTTSVRFKIRAHIVIEDKAWLYVPSLSRECLLSSFYSTGFYPQMR